MGIVTTFFNAFYVPHNFWHILNYFQKVNSFFSLIYNHRDILLLSLKRNRKNFNWRIKSAVHYHYISQGCYFLYFHIIKPFNHTKYSKESRWICIIAIWNKRSLGFLFIIEMNRYFTFSKTARRSSTSALLIKLIAYPKLGEKSKLMKIRKLRNLEHESLLTKLIRHL